MQFIPETDAAATLQNEVSLNTHCNVKIVKWHTS